MAFAPAQSPSTGVSRLTLARHAGPLKEGKSPRPAPTEAGRGAGRLRLVSILTSQTEEATAHGGAHEGPRGHAL